MERKSSTLNKQKESNKDLYSYNPLAVKKVKPPRRWFNSIMTIEIIGICICFGLIIAKVVLENLS